MTVAARRRRSRAVRAAVAGVAGLAGIAPLPARAQVTVALDVGAATVAYDEFDRSVVLSATPSVLLERGRATLVAHGAYSRFETGNRSLQGTLAGSVYSAALWKLRGELAGSISSTRYEELTAATSLIAVGRLHLAEPNRGVWVGAGAGGVAQGFNFPDDLLQLELNGWMRVASTVFQLGVTPTRVDSLTYADAEGSMRWVHPRGEASASGGWRLGDRGSGVSRWAEVSATLWLNRWVAVTGGGGVFPAELPRGLPGGRYASMALRFASRPPRVADPKLVAQLILPYELRGLRRSPAQAERFVVGVAPDGTRSLRIQVPGARSVELLADFTDWLPTRLTREGGDLWGLNVFVAPGVHRLLIRVDGGPWTPPPGLTVVNDDFGARVGLLVVQ